MSDSPKTATVAELLAGKPDLTTPGVLPRLFPIGTKITTADGTERVVTGFEMTGRPGNRHLTGWLLAGEGRANPRTDMYATATVEPPRVAGEAARIDAMNAAGTIKRWSEPLPSVRAPVAEQAAPDLHRSAVSTLKHIDRVLAAPAGGTSPERFEVEKAHLHELRAAVEAAPRSFWRSAYEQDLDTLARDLLGADRVAAQRAECRAAGRAARSDAPAPAPEPVAPVAEPAAASPAAPVTPRDSLRASLAALPNTLEGPVLRLT